MRTCNRCLSSKNESEFYWNKGGTGKPVLDAQCRTCVREIARLRYANDTIFRNKKKAYARTPERIEKTRRAGVAATTKRLKTDVEFKLKHMLRTRLRCALYNSQKTGSAVADLGCSVSELKAHLESQFQPGMSWNNWSKTGWHIDHKIPLSKFKLSDRNQLLKASHFTNLQPLWAEQNLEKSNK